MIKINEYFDGAVKSFEYNTAAGKSTVGVIDSGEFEFCTAMHEIMTVIEGQLLVMLPQSTGWETYSAGETFAIPANASFKVRSAGQTAYLCQYH